MSTGALPARSLVRDVGWGLFLASSWTWCIGMFLPVVMLREYGWLGFLVFALPNVAGCTWFGWSMPPDRGRRLLVRGGWLAALFSVVTVAYHLFFCGFVARTLMPLEDRAAPGTALIVCGALFVLALVLSFVRSSRWPLMGTAAWIVSLACWLGLTATGSDPAPGAALASATEVQWGWTGQRPSWQLLFLAWPLVFGFLWSPWFDLTFHRARREAGSPRPFAIFGAAFALMLLFTASYAWQAEDPAAGLGLWVLLHLTVQGVFTVAAHLRELREAPSQGPEAGGDSVVTGPDEPGVTDVFAPRLLPVVVGAWLAAAGLGAVAPSEPGYLRFLVFYGLFVPALGMLVMAPPRHRADRLLLPLAAILLLGCVLEELAFNRGVAWVAWIPYVLLLLWRRRLSSRRRVLA